MDHLLPRFALAASVFVSACSGIPLVSAPTPVPVETVPAKRAPTPMICEDRTGRQVRCTP